MAIYNKEYKSFDDLTDQLISRGLQGKRADIKSVLEQVGYYRITGYLFPYKNEDDTFADGVTLQKILYIYNFDTELRNLLFSYIENIELYLRTQLVHKLSELNGPFGYQDSSTLPGFKITDYARFIKSSKNLFDSSHEKFIDAFKENYPEKDNKYQVLPPYWMLANIIQLGQVKNLYIGSPYNVQKFIANKFNLNHKVFRSWLLTLNTVRNICAHYGRLWNRVIGTSPKIPNKGKELYSECVYFNRVAVVFFIIKRLLVSINTDNFKDFKKLESLLKKYHKIDYRKMGIVDKDKTYRALFSTEDLIF